MLTHQHFLVARQLKDKPTVNLSPRTFQRHPVLLPFPPSHQLQFPLLLQGDKGFEEEPPGFPDHSLLLLKEQIQLLQGAQRLAARLHGFRGRVGVLHVGPAHFQLSHEVLVNVLLEGIAANHMSGFASLRQGLN